MTRYEYLEQMSDHCMKLYAALRALKDYHLAAFYFNAALGFQKKKETLTLEEAGM